ncbi:unnamed protein product, partial [Gongylonema pulchrum]|uniref:Mitochondrial fission process protein 1 n=1 Tax=Gongylonema pulchrum TaxID=637853 RepID=A0A183D1R3_9BILA
IYVSGGGAAKKWASEFPVSFRSRFFRGCDGARTPHIYTSCRFRRTGRSWRFCRIEYCYPFRVSSLTFSGMASLLEEKNLHDEAQKDLHKVDIFRDTPVRLLGYANEIGEAFRAWVSANAVRLSYVVASSYVFADTADKAHKTYQPVEPLPQEKHPLEHLDEMMMYETRYISR